MTSKKSFKSKRPLHIIDRKGMIHIKGGDGGSGGNGGEGGPGNGAPPPGGG